MRKSLNFTITNLLIGLSFIWYVIFNYTSYKYWYSDNYLSLFIQFFVSTFLHWWFFHFFFNSVMLAYFWNIVELNLKEFKYILFFVFSVVFNWVFVYIFSWMKYNVIWVSGFCMAVLAFFTFDFKYLSLTLSLNKSLVTFVLSYFWSSFLLSK